MKESGEQQISPTTISDKLVSHCLCTLYSVGSGQHCHVCSGGDSLCSNSSDGGTVTDCGDGVSTCLLGKSSKFITMSLSTVDKGKLEFELDRPLTGAVVMRSKYRPAPILCRGQPSFKFDH